MDFTLLEKINSDSGIFYILIRTVIIYLFAVLLLRYGSTRFKLRTPFDYVIVIIIGAVLGRTLYGGTSLLATLLASFLLVLLHELFARLAFHFHFFGKIFKGEAYTLIEDNQMLHDAMKKNNITADDLLEVCRHQCKHEDLTAIEKAILERSGQINIINSNVKSHDKKDR